MDNLLIRRIKIEDADDIARIQAAITKPSEDFDFRPIIEEQVRRKENASFVAELNGDVVGYMISYVVYGGYGLEKSAWIATLGVDTKYMGAGVGKRLAEEIFDAYRKMGIRNIYTSVRWDSADLLSFFKTLEFERSDFINLKKKLDF